MSSYALHLANLAEAKGIELCKLGIKKVMCSAEPVSQAKRDKIERTLGREAHRHLRHDRGRDDGRGETTTRRGLPHLDRPVLHRGARPEVARAGEGGRGRHAGGDRAADQQRHAVPALELGRPRHLQRGRRQGRDPFRCSRASSTRTAPPASSRSAASTSATRTSRTSSSASLEIGDFRAEAVNEGGNDFLELSIEVRRGCDAVSALRRDDFADEGEVRADASDRGAGDRHPGPGVRSQRQGRAVRRPALTLSACAWGAQAALRVHQTIRTCRALPDYR